jgi:hypothetical protein
VKAAMSPDGAHTVVVGQDGEGWLWDVRPSAWEERACSVAGRQLTRDEWAQFLPGRPFRAVCPA